MEARQTGASCRRARGRGGASGEQKLSNDQKPVAAARAPAREALQTVSAARSTWNPFPVLSAHVIDGHAVLPVALILEWMAEAAVHRNPGLVVCGVDDFRLFKGVILGHQKPATVELRAGKPVRRAAQFAVPVELCGTLANGKEVVHARAVIVLGDRHDTPRPRLGEPELSAYPLLRDEIYQTVLFHGPLMQGIESVEGCGERGIAGLGLDRAVDFRLDRPALAQQMVDRPAGDRLRLSARRLVDAGDRSVPTHSRPAWEACGCFTATFPEQGVRVLVEIEQSSPSRATAAIEILDDDRRLIARLDNFECVIDASLNQAFRRNQLPSRFSVVPS